MRFTVSLTLSLLAVVYSQTAGPQPTLIYTYNGQSAPASLLSAISSAAAGPNALLSAAGADTATNAVPAFPTTATVGPGTIPQVTGSNVFTSAASGEVFPTATRAPYTSIGTYNTTLTSPTSVTSVKPAAGVKGMEARGALTLMMGCLGVVGGVLVL